MEGISPRREIRLTDWPDLIQFRPLLYRIPQRLTFSRDQQQLAE